MLVLVLVPLLLFFWISNRCWHRYLNPYGQQTLFPLEICMSS